MNLLEQALAKGLPDGETEGFVKILIKAGTDKILGATIVARHAGEMISEVSTAMAAGLGLGALAAVIHPYPTQAEAIRQTGDLYNRTRLTPSLKRWFTRYLPGDGNLVPLFKGQNERNGTDESYYRPIGAYPIQYLFLVANTSKYHRLKNMAIKGMKSLLLSSGLAKLSKFNHLPEHGGEALPGD